MSEENYGTCDLCGRFEKLKRVSGRWTVLRVCERCFNREVLPSRSNIWSPLYQSKS